MNQTSYAAGKFCFTNICICLLQHYYKSGKFVVENVIPYYEPLIPAQKRGRHLYWTNFILPNDVKDRGFKIGRAEKELDALCKFHDYNFNKYKGEQSVIKMARNLVDYEAGRTIFEIALGIVSKKQTNQIELF